MGKKKSPGGLVDEIEAYVKRLPWKERVKVAGNFFEFDAWPEGVPMKPDGWDNMTRDERWDITIPICDRLDHIVSPKASRRYWYIQIRGYSKKEFREYWRDRYRGGETCRDIILAIWIYVMGIFTGVQIAMLIVRIALMSKGAI